MRAVDEGAARQHLRVRNHLIDRVDRPDRDPGAHQNLLPLFVRFREEAVLQRVDERLAIRDARRICRVTGIGSHPIETQERTERSPQLFVADAEREIARPGPERLIREHRRVRRAPRAGDHPVGEIGANDAVEDAHLRFEHRHVDELAAAGPATCVQRRQDRERREHPGGDVGDRHARAHAGAARGAGYADHAAFSLHDQIERRAVAVRAVLAEAGDRAVDDLRITVTRARVVDPQLLHGADPQVLQHHVRPIEQPEEDRPALRVLQVDRDALLVAVKVDEVGRFPLDAASRTVVPFVERRPPRPGHVARAGRFDLDDFRAVVRQHRRREGPGQRVGKIEDGDVV
jgi:hypothetical protein